MMKLTILISVLLMVVPAFAKKEPKVYTLTGSISFQSFHADSEAHISVGGQTYDRIATRPARASSVPTPAEPSKLYSPMATHRYWSLMRRIFSTPIVTSDSRRAIHCWRFLSPE
jgi:hypothetical protein